MLRSDRGIQSTLEKYPFIVRMATKHGTKTWFENPAFQRLTANQLLLAQGAISAEFFAFDKPENQELGEIVSVQSITRTATQGMLWRKSEVTLPVLTEDIIAGHPPAGNHAAVLSYEARRLHSSGGGVALRGIMPEDIALLLSHTLEKPEQRRGMFQALVQESPYYPIFSPDFAAIDQAGLKFKVV